MHVKLNGNNIKMQQQQQRCRGRTRCVFGYPNEGYCARIYIYIHIRSETENNNNRLKGEQKINYRAVTGTGIQCICYWLSEWQQHHRKQNKQNLSLFRTHSVICVIYIYINALLHMIYLRAHIYTHTHTYRPIIEARWQRPINPMMWLYMAFIRKKVAERTDKQSTP